jgi:MFS family permease
MGKSAVRAKLTLGLVCIWTGIRLVSHCYYKMSRAKSSSGMLISGRMADLFGRKLLYMLGLSIFVVFSIISGVLRVSRTFEEQSLT